MLSNMVFTHTCTPFTVHVFFRLPQHNHLSMPVVCVGAAALALTRHTVVRMTGLSRGDATLQFVHCSGTNLYGSIQVRPFPVAGDQVACFLSAWSSKSRPSPFAKGHSRFLCLCFFVHGNPDFWEGIRIFHVLRTCAGQHPRFNHVDSATSKVLN